VNSYVSDLPIGELLVRAGLVSQNQIDDAAKEAGTRDRLIGRVLVNRGYIEPEKLRAALSAQSLLRDGVIDSFKAFKALSNACCNNTTLEAALASMEEPNKKPSSEPTAKLGELLLCAGVINQATLNQCHEKSLRTGDPLGVVLVAENHVTPSYLDAALELQVRIRDGMFSREQAIEALKQDPRRLLDMIAPHMVADSQRKTATKNALRLGELLVRAGIISNKDVNQALELSLAQKNPIGEALVNRGFITKALLDAALSVQRMLREAQLTVGDATACLIKVFKTERTVSECLLELNILKSQPVTKIKDYSGYFKKVDRSATRTINELPALVLKTRVIENESPASSTSSELEAIELEAIEPKTNNLESAEVTEMKLAPDAKNGEAVNFLYGSMDRKEFSQALHDAYSRLGRVLLKRGELLTAEDLLLDAVVIAQSYHLDAKLLSDLMFLAGLYLKEGKSWQSERLLKRCMQIIEKEPTKCPLLEATCHHRLALIYCHLSLLFKAEKHFKSAAALIESDLATKYPGEEHNHRGTRIKQLNRKLSAVFKDHAVLLNRMRRESEADKFYCLARKTLSSSLLTG
jgi:tetratricopeptide (TPR) repeat protein